LRDSAGVSPDFAKRITTENSCAASTLSGRKLALLHCFLPELQPITEASPTAIACLASKEATLFVMEYRRLGSSGMYVSEISYGNWITHGSQVEQEAAIKCVHAALDVGITTFDTADVYAGTKAESVLGKALKGVKRESYELFTKVYWPTGPGKNDRGLSRKHIMESVNASLKRLNTDHIDLYQMHRFDFETPLEESLCAFDDLIRQGKVNYIGFSEWTAAQIGDALKIQKANGFNRFISSQPQYSMLWRVIEAKVLPLCVAEGIGQIVWSPVAQGVLTGKYLPGKKPPSGSRATDKKSGAEMISRWMRDEVLTAVQRLKPIAANLDLTMSQLALAWALANPNVSSVIMGASKPSQVKENVKASGIKISPQVLAEIDKALGSIPETSPERTESPNPRA
jgi:aryl-alcohol dehydrogenase-like predicted oxidoreductase